jgi:hypothetical protein
MLNPIECVNHTQWHCGNEPGCRCTCHNGGPFVEDDVPFEELSDDDKRWAAEGWLEKEANV